MEFVIFDEVHYVNDMEVCMGKARLTQRGVVWEEVIILLPSHINIVLLSATVPNTKGAWQLDAADAEFADWVGRTKKKDVYVISTSKRPVPLEHFIYAGKELHRIVDAKSRFLASGVHAANDALKSKQEREGTAPVRGARGGARGAQRGGARGGGGRVAPRGGRGGGAMSGRRGDDRSLWVHLVGLLKKKSLLPVVVFVFSKRRCEEYANSLPNTDLCTAKEKSEVHISIERSLTRLKGAYVHAANHRRRSRPSADPPHARAAVSRHWRAPQRFASNHEGDGRDPLSARLGQGAVCHRDVCDGRQYAGAQRCL